MKKLIICIMLIFGLLVPSVPSAAVTTVYAVDTMLEVPAKPYNIVNVVSGVHVYWKAVNGCTKYGVWRSETGKDGTYKWLGNPQAVHFTDTKVESGKTYYYKITAMDSKTNKHSEKSEAMGITYVSTPDITQRFNKAAGVTVTWDKITGATGYAIYRKSFDGNDAWVRVATVKGNKTFTWQDTSVKNANGTVYRYTVRALAGSNLKTLSGCRNIGRTMVRLTSRTLNSAVAVSETSVKCTWGTTAKATGYEVRFMVGSEVYKTVTIGNYKTGVKTFNGLEEGTTYKIQVRSYKKVDGVGSFYSAWSEAKYATTAGEKPEPTATPTPTPGHAQIIENVCDAVRDAYGENYPYTVQMQEDTYFMQDVLKMDSSWYDEAVVEAAIMASRMETFAIFHATEGNLQNVRLALEKYKEKVIEEQRIYKDPFLRACSAVIATIDNEYVVFSMLPSLVDEDYENYDTEEELLAAYKESSLVAIETAGNVIGGEIEIGSDLHFEWIIGSDGGITITKLVRSVIADVVIPEEIEGLKVTAIGKEAFKDNTLVESIVIPSTVTRIEDYAFSGCSALEDIELPDSVTVIGDKIFENCSKLMEPFYFGILDDGTISITGTTNHDIEELVILEKIVGRSVKNIGDEAFAGCLFLKTVTIPDCIKEIQCRAFSDCTELENVEISNGVTEIADGAFQRCYKLKKMIIPASVSYIGNSVFTDCNLDVIYVTAGSYAETWAKENGYKVGYVNSDGSLVEPTPSPTASPEDKVYLHENSNVDTINAVTVGAMPCIGNAKILVFYVDFKNGQINWSKSVQEVEAMFFSEEGKYDSTLAYSEKDSLRSFYFRSSYGKVDIIGDVYEYETKYDTTYYNCAEAVLSEILSQYGESINWDDYDGNNDGYIDGIYVIARNKHSFGGPNYVGSYEGACCNKKIGKFCFIDSTNIQTLCHETCHMFGAADMYSGVSLNPAGIQTACIMEQGSGDLPGATKYVYGWLDDVQFVDINTAGTFQLRSYSNFGDALVIYPNGDSSNRNWFIVEYVTAEGNNPLGGGLRVWKTQMNLDEEKNINGSKEYCNGMPASPYEYLEAVHPDTIWNYYMCVGETLTPYTYPSTSYSDEFYLIGGSKFLKDLDFSGIHIEFVKEENGVAEVRVKMQETPDASYDINSEVMVFMPETSSAFLDSSEGYLLATLEVDTEINVSGEAMLVSEDKQHTIPLHYNVLGSNKEISFLIDISAYNNMDSQVYHIVYPEITTYYGKKITIDDTAEVVVAEIPTPYHQVSETFYADLPFQTYYYNMKSFKKNEETVFTLSLDSVQCKMFWTEIDLTSNQTVTEELELPTGLNAGELMHELLLWTEDESYYLHCNEFICCYQDKKLTGYLNVMEAAKEQITFCGSNQNSFFYGEESGKFYKLHNNGEEIWLQQIELFTNHADTEAMQEITAQISSANVYCLSDEVYIINAMHDMYYVTRERILKYQFQQAAPRNVRLVDDKLYVFECGTDFLMHVFDYNFNFIHSKVLLTGLTEVVWRPVSFEVELINGAWIISFESISNSNTISFASTFITVFDLDGNIMNYYRYGDSSFRYVCEVIPLSKDDIVCINTFENYLFFHISPWADIDENR